MLTRKQQHSKRFFDITATLLLLPFAIIPVLLLLLMATMATKANGLFVQTRIGQYGKPFQLYKIRTLKGVEHTDIVAIKNNETPFGSWLRRSKLDELPQLLNVLKGDMSWVGPRPDVPGYADRLEGEDREILDLKPGITGPATLKYKNEEELLLQQANPLKYNDTVLWPDKVEINKNYSKNWSLKNDMKYMLQSVFG